MIKKTFFWTLILVIIGIICALFLTDDFTQSCSNTLIECLEKHRNAPFFNKMFDGSGCVFRNIWCVLTKGF